jgi:short-subunit dehydrogenase
MARMELAGSRVLLTGASGGIGQAIARALHARGASVVATARRAEVLEELRESLGGERLEPQVADLSDRGDVAELARKCAEVDVLVANAALPASGRVDDFSPEQIDRALDVNLRAPIQLTRALMTGMIERGRGHFVFISSLSGKVATARSGLYSATKFGLRGFATGLRADLHDSGVGVTTVFPGFITGAGMFEESGVDLPAGVGSRSPAQVADAVVAGIERGKPEIDVAPVGLRASAVAAAVAPGLAARVGRRLGSADLAEQIAQGQADKR